MRWLTHLQFASARIEHQALKIAQKALKREELSVRQKWLGAYFQREISEGAIPDVSIEWVSKNIGFGVFAKRFFPAGSYLGEYTGIVRPRRGKLDRKNDYCFEYAIGEKSPWVIDAQDQGNHTRFINHSNCPNIEPVAVYSEGRMHIVFFSIRPIEAGTELLYEYGPYFWKKRKEPIC